MPEGPKAEKARTFPTSVPFFLLYNFFERYCSMGVGAILAIFLNTQLGLSEHTSVAIYHYFFFASYFFGIIGAIIADNWLGRFKTLLFGMSIVGGIGNFMLAIGTVEWWSFLKGPFVALGLVLLSLGVGCLEPNIPAYTGDQYRLPLEQKGFSLAIGLIFVMQNLARIVAILLGPYLRRNTTCFGVQGCYPLIFGIFVIAQLVGIVVLVVGTKFAVVKIPGGNMFVEVCGCIWNGFKTKFFTRPKVTQPHWLDYSEPKYGKNIVDDTKRVVHILTLIPPLIITASLYFQQASRWTFQSRQMNGRVGSWVIEPDQVPLVNAISTSAFVPLCEYVIIPLLSKIRIKTNLQLATLGMFLSATAFVIAAIVQFRVDRLEPLSMHMAWQIPQHVVLALGEVLVYVQFLQFAYTQAPKEMKSVLQAFFSMVIGGGNLIVALIATTEIFSAIAYEYLMFAGIVYLAMIIFIFLAMRYEYVVVESESDEPEKSVDDEVVKNGHDFLRHRNGSIIEDDGFKENYNTRL